MPHQLPELIWMWLPLREPNPVLAAKFPANIFILTNDLIMSDIYHHCWMTGIVRPRHGRFDPGKETRYPTYRRLGEPQGRYGRVRKISPPPRFDPRTAQPVASRFTDWAIPVFLLKEYKYKGEFKQLRKSSAPPPPHKKNYRRSHRAFWTNYQGRKIHSFYVNDPMLVDVRIWTLTPTTLPFTSEAVNIHGHFPYHALVFILPKNQLSTK
jgi:hypothetical protein